MTATIALTTEEAEAIARESQPEWDFRFGRLELL